jgi:hypothetical protein
MIFNSVSLLVAVFVMTMTMPRLLLWLGLVSLLQHVHVVHENRTQVESEQNNQMANEQ